MLTQQDRDAIDELFRRLLEAERRGGPRDPEAEALIRQKLSAQPAAPYYLGQTVVVQQEALKRAEQRIEELEGKRRGPWDRDERYDSRGYASQGAGGFLAGAAQTAMGVAGGLMLGSLIGSIFSAGPASATESGAAQEAPESRDEPSDGPEQDFGTGDLGDGGFDLGGDF